MNLPKETKEILEALAPELSKSEDESIRKFLVDYFTSYKIGNVATKLNGVRIDDILNYLEKQKEVKWSPSECEMGVLYKLCYVSNQITDEDDTELTRLYQDLKREYFNGHSFENMFPKEKQKEQKPESCDCSRDEESYTNGIHHVLMNPEAYGLIKQKPAEQLGGTFTSYDMAKTFTEGQNYVIAHPEKFGLCKPAEWSEEDKDKVVQYLHDRDGGMLWSKATDITRDILDMLRPSWKPSENQMEAIENVIKCELSAGLHTRANILQTLQNDLKKL